MTIESVLAESLVRSIFTPIRISLIGALMDAKKQQAQHERQMAICHAQRVEFYLLKSQIEARLK